MSSQKTVFVVLLQLQFLTTPVLDLTNTFANPTSNKSNVFERDWSKFIVDYFDIDWSNLLNLD